MIVAYLRGAYMRGAYLRGAYLRGADLRGADLRDANLRGADLRDAKNIPTITASILSITPSGQFIAWKKCKDGVLVKLMVGKNAKRSNATGRKCRAEYVKVLEVIGATVGFSSHDDGVTKYEVGKIVRCDQWEEDRWIECAGGIHFFLTREEAENY